MKSLQAAGLDPIGLDSISLGPPRCHGVESNQVTRSGPTRLGPTSFGPTSSGLIRSSSTKPPNWVPRGWVLSSHQVRSHRAISSGPTRLSPTTFWPHQATSLDTNRPTKPHSCSQAWKNQQPLRAGAQHLHLLLPSISSWPPFRLTLPGCHPRAQLPSGKPAPVPSTPDASLGKYVQEHQDGHGSSQPGGARWGWRCTRGAKLASLGRRGLSLW